MTPKTVRSTSSLRACGMSVDASGAGVGPPRASATEATLEIDSTSHIFLNARITPRSVDGHFFWSKWNGDVREKTPHPWSRTLIACSLGQILRHNFVASDRRHLPPAEVGKPLTLSLSGVRPASGGLASHPGGRPPRALVVRPTHRSAAFTSERHRTVECATALASRTPASAAARTR